ncbi:MAG: P-type conjugative transfer protein TrbG [Deltaproteobacteria bacterium]|jgi:type IV secretion system protein VirB9|nr:P-type conjugative transfer protein TrbG [Deltaproteobacteria bacterium]
MRQSAAVIILILMFSPSAAAADEQAIYEHAYQDALRNQQVGVVRDMPDYLSPRQVPLTKAEREAMQMASEWAKNPNKPIMLSNGKVSFMYGASIPTVISAPMKITDLEFESGENIQNVLLGDTARWQVDSGSVGAVPHLFVKPLDAGLETNAVITTGKRVYHLRFISQRKDSMSYVGFIYPEHSLAIMRNQAAKEEKDARFKSFSGPASGHFDMTSLDFRYDISGFASWKPTQVYNDGMKTYIRLPDNIQETPILVAKNSGYLVNYRFVNNVYVVDGLFDELSLVLGVGSSQEQISIKKIE